MIFPEGWSGCFFCRFIDKTVFEKERQIAHDQTSFFELIEDAGLTARTNGFSLSLAGRMKYVSGQIKIKCKKGMGMSGFQPGEAGAGSYFEAEPFRPEMSMVRDVSTMAFAQIVKSGGINVTGEERVTVKLECPGE